MATGPDEFVFAGTGLTITFETGLATEVGILSVEEGRFVNGQWQPGRRLNGDQTHQGRHLRLPTGKFGIQRIKLYRYR
jgi:beta-galactosidase GanA